MGMVRSNRSCENGVFHHGCTQMDTDRIVTEATVKDTMGIGRPWRPYPSASRKGGPAVHGRGVNSSYSWSFLSFILPTFLKEAETELKSGLFGSG
jgi:hypothetical protein